jgi:adenylylsulfate kinase
MKEIHPIFHKQLGRRSKERLLHQRGAVIWLTGLSGSGKSTIALGLERELFRRKFLTMHLDGDNIRSGLSDDLGFSIKERTENMRRVAEVAKLFVQCGVVTICSFVSPTCKMRNRARKIIGDKLFHEIYINASFEECERRDVKGLYAKAREGRLKLFTGINSPFEAPVAPQLEINTEELSIKDSIRLLVDYVLPFIERK